MLFMMIPAVCALLAFVFWSFVALIKKNWLYLKYEFISTVVVLFFLIHPSLVKAMFSVFNCRYLDEDRLWVVENLEIECWTEEHTFYALFIALPSIAVWGIGVPAICLVFLIQRFRSRLKEITVKVRFGFLYNGYEEHTFYWEFVIMYRKIMIIACSVFLGTISIPVQALTCFLVLIVALHLQNQIQPFDRYELNQMEIRAIIVATVTIYCGLYYLTDDLNEVSKINLFVIMIVSNVYFLVYWI
jgi:hypothetical protein